MTLTDLFRVASDEQQVLVFDIDNDVCVYVGILTNCPIRILRGIVQTISTEDNNWLIECNF